MKPTTNAMARSSTPGTGGHQGFFKTLCSVRMKSAIVPLSAKTMPSRGSVPSVTCFDTQARFLKLVTSLRPPRRVPKTLPLSEIQPVCVSSFSPQLSGADLGRTRHAAKSQPFTHAITGSVKAHGGTGALACVVGFIVRIPLFARAVPERHVVAGVKRPVVPEAFG